MGFKCDFKVHILASLKEYCTADFGTRQKDYPTHKGIDVINGAGGICYVIAAADGIVISAQNSVDGFDNKVYTAGNMVHLYHPSTGLHTRYLHLRKGSVTVKEGDKVKRGDILGVMGNTGLSYGTHLHFDIYNGTKYIDPLPFLSGNKKLSKKIVPVVTRLKVGDIVGVKPGAKFTNGARPYKFVYDSDFTVLDMSKDGKTVLVGLDGKATGWFFADALILVAAVKDEGEKKPDEKTTPNIKVGDVVRVKNGATTYYGGKLASFVYGNKYTVLQVGTADKEDYIVIGINEQVTAAVRAEDLIKV